MTQTPAMTRYPRAISASYHERGIDPCYEPPRVIPQSVRSHPLGLGTLLDTRRVILCVGCGGVGKTTTTAALGLAAARRGKRVLCLTIDPARRLSQSLGLAEMTTEAHRIETILFEQAGYEVSVSLTVMRIDTR